MDLKAVEDESARFKSGLGSTHRQHISLKLHYALLVGEPKPDL